MTLVSFTSKTLKTIIAVSFGWDRKSLVLCVVVLSGCLSVKPELVLTNTLLLC